MAPRFETSDLFRGRPGISTSGGKPDNGTGFGDFCARRALVADPKPNYTEPTCVGDMSLESIVKDLHWCTQKIMLVTERSMVMIEGTRDALQAQVRTATMLPPAPTNTAAFDMNSIDQTIRSAVSSAVLSMETEVIQTMDVRWKEQIAAQATRDRTERQRQADVAGFALKGGPNTMLMQLASLGEQMQRAFDENAQHCQNELQGHFERSRAHDAYHAGTIDVQAQAHDLVLKKIDKLTDLVSAQAGDRHSQQPVGFWSGGIAVGLGANETGISGAPGSEGDGWDIGIVGPTTPTTRTPGKPGKPGASATAKAPKEQEKVSKRENSPMSQSLSEKQAASQPFIEMVASSSQFEMAFGLLIVLNTVKMCVEAEYRGWEVGHKLGIEEMLGTTQTTTAGADQVFYIFELMFGIVFTFEVFVKMMALRCSFGRSAWNMFDTGIISVAWFSTFVKLKLPISPMVLRLFRLVRLLRLLRSLSSFAIFDDLQLMVRALRAGAPVLIWVFFLIGPAISCVALFMTYALGDFIVDETKPRQDRIECFNYFGTFTKSFLSIFEVTFANWVPICRFLYGKVDERFALFFMGYKLGMGIAVLRIVYGVFLHVTFRCAVDDESLMIAQKNREQKHFSKRIRTLFTKFDTSGNGFLSKEEFHRCAKDARVQTLLSAMDLPFFEPDLVFELCCAEGSDELTADQMIYGFSHLKGFARSTSIAELLHRETKANDKLDKLVILTSQMATKIGVLGGRNSAAPKTIERGIFVGNV